MNEKISKLMGQWILEGMGRWLDEWMAINRDIKMGQLYGYIVKGPQTRVLNSVWQRAIQKTSR